MKDSYKYIVSSEQMIKQCVRDMHQMLKDHGYFNFEIKQGNRSLSQNALYWIWMGEIADYLNIHNGSDFKPEEIHMRMKHDFLGYTTESKVGSTVIPPQLRSTSKLTKGEMFDYMRQVDAWAAGVKLYLSRPEDCQYERIKKQQA